MQSQPFANTFQNSFCPKTKVICICAHREGCLLIPAQHWKHWICLWLSQNGKWILILFSMKMKHFLSGLLWGLGLLHQTPIRLLISFDRVNIFETNVCPVYSRKTDHFCRIHLMLLVEIRFRGIETQRGPRDFGSSLADFSITWTAIGQFLGAWEPYRIGLWEVHKWGEQGHLLIQNSNRSPKNLLGVTK